MQSKQTHKPNKKKKSSKAFSIKANYGCLGEKGTYFPWELRYYCLLSWVLSSRFLHSKIFSGEKENFSRIVLVAKEKDCMCSFHFLGSSALLSNVLFFCMCAPFMIYCRSVPRLIWRWGREQHCLKKLFWYSWQSLLHYKKCNHRHWSCLPSKPLKPAWENVPLI